MSYCVYVVSDDGTQGALDLTDTWAQAALNRQESPARTVHGILIPVQPSLDQLIQITRTLAHDYDFVRVVLASTPSNLQDNTQLDAEFIEVTDGPEFRTEEKAISQSAGTAGNALYLGLSELE